MTYQQTVEYLLTRLPMYSRIGVAAYKDNLDNIIRLCAYLGDPQTKFKSIHIAGTNGKGSVSHMLAAVLQQSGYKTGLHTSPHLKDFRERIRINGEMVSKEFVIDFTKKIKPIIEEIEPSFFEISVAMTFDWFAQQAVDIAIIETGLGGRLDSTNIISPELSVITNISLDHMNLLGDTVEQIATEKAGIIKKGIPSVVGEPDPATQPVFEKVAAAKQSPLSLATRRFRAIEWTWEKHLLAVEVAEQNKTDHHRYHLDLTGVYQVKNLITVLECCYQLRLLGWKLQEDQIRKALEQVKKITGLHGRWEIIQEHPLVVLDVGHNEAGIRQILEQIEVTDHHALHIVLGMVKDKEINRVLALLPRTARYYFTQAQIPRAIDATELMHLAGSFELKGHWYANVNHALNAAKQTAGKGDLIVVMGSIFLVGEVEI
jgi:dihydrofolate synthase / folylpolyglutamate synthase